MDFHDYKGTFPFLSCPSFHPENPDSDVYAVAFPLEVLCDHVPAKEVFISLTTYMLECTSSPGRGRFLLAEGIRETDPKFEIPGRSRALNRNPALGEYGEGDGSGPRSGQAAASDETVSLMPQEIA